MAVFRWYKNGAEVRTFTVEAWNALGGASSGWAYMTQTEQDALNALNTYSEWQAVSPIENRIFKEVETFADLSNLPKDSRFFVHVKADESEGNVGKADDGSNPSTYYFYNVQKSRFEQITSYIN